MTGTGSWQRTWRRPVQMALLTAAGLVSALMGTGAWHWFAWACLAVPVLVTIRALLARQGGARQGSGPLR